MDEIRFLLEHRRHAENVFWSRIQVLHLNIQVAVLGGGFVLWKANEKGLSVASILVGLLLTVILGLLARNDWADASVNDHRIDTLSGDNYRRTAPGWRLRSHNLICFVILLFLGIDIGFLFWLIGRNNN